MKPRSLNIRHIAQMQIGDTISEIRYSKTAPIKEPHGVLKFRENSTDVMTRISTTDIDFAFFFWAYSKQNIKNNPQAKLMIENLKYEAERIANAKRNEAAIMAKLWNSESEGGVSINVLIEYAKTCPTIVGVEEMSDDEIRNAIEFDFSVNKMGKANFFQFTHDKKVSKKEVEEIGNIIGDAIKTGVIIQKSPTQSFVWGESGEDIWSWKGTVGIDKPSVKLYKWLQSNEPETLEKISSLTAEKIAVEA
jgi:hypothetical protein